MEKILTADFSNGASQIRLRGIWQHDYGAKLKVKGIDYSTLVRIDFAGANDPKAYPVVAVQETDGTFTAKIPKEVTDQAYDINAYIYVSGNDAGYTVKEVVMPVRERVEADPASGGGTATDPYAAVIEKMTEFAEGAKTSAGNAALSADTAGKSASAAQQAARSAAESASTATAAAQTATTAAGKASESATTATQAAETAGQKATAAETAAGKAAESATAAEKSATAAGASAAAAKESETAAGLAAQTVQEQAEKIKASAEQIEKNKTDVASLKEDLGEQESKLEPIVKSNEDSKDAFYIVDVYGNIICKVDKDGVHSVGFDGKNLALNDVISTYEDSFYISDSNGNVIFKADKDGVRGLNMDASSNISSPFKGMKLLTIGDSLSAHNNWQKWLVEWLGVTFDNDENINGKDGHKPMAKGGTAIAPTSEDSIYMRALDAKYYVDDTNGTVIIVYAGQNDSVALGTIDDTPYTDKTVTASSNLTFYSSYMGMIENILADIPSARIYLMTQMPVRLEIGMEGTAEPYVGVVRFPDMESVLKYESSRYKKVEAIRAISKKYSLPCIDLWEDSGINDYNSKYWYGAVGGTCGQVHPNNIGYKRMAEVAVAKMY